MSLGDGQALQQVRGQAGGQEGCTQGGKQHELKLRSIVAHHGA